MLPDNLPPFPSVALKALHVLAGTETSLRELCDVIRPDPVFSAEVLRLANSPLVAFSKPVTSVLQAAMLLGFRRLRRLVVTVGLRAYIGSASARLLQTCWRHSVATAMVAEQVARWGSIEREFAYTAGILHDVGRVVLASIDAQAYGRLLERVFGQSSEMLRFEQELFGVDHCRAGSHLVTAWQLPDEFTDITLHHHEAVSGGDNAAEIMRLSCRLADALGFPSDPHRCFSKPEEVLVEFPENLRAQLGKPKEMSAGISKEISLLEAAPN